MKFAPSWASAWRNLFLALENCYLLAASKQVSTHYFLNENYAGFQTVCSPKEAEELKNSK